MASIHSVAKMANNLLDTKDDLESALGIVRALMISLHESTESRMNDSDIVAALRAVDDLIGQSCDTVENITDLLAELNSKQREIMHVEAILWPYRKLKKCSTSGQTWLSSLHWRENVRIRYRKLRPIWKKRPDVTHQTIMKRIFEHFIDLFRLAYYTESRSVQ